MATSRRLLLSSVPLVAVGLLSACTGSSRSAPSDRPEPGAEAAPADTETLTSGLQAPWSIAFHGQTSLLSERDTARVLELTTDGATREVGVIDGVTPGGEGGLLGLAAHEGMLFSYATTDSGNRIERRALAGAPGQLALGAPEVLLDGIPSAANHNGGRLKIGPGGMLFATTGDAGDRRAAQDPDSLAGKILRLTPDGAVPEDNPFPGSPVFSYGHRNPQGLAWTADGQLVASEFGQNTWDELNLIEPGANYGWPDVEGIGGQEGLTDPLLQWSPAEASPSGIAIQDGTVFIACLRGQRLRAVPLADPQAQTELLVEEVGRLRDAVIAPDGSLCVLTNTTDGRGDPAPNGDRVLRVEVTGG
ncbi:glucose dehydrogenase [Brachybacterium vulturis]|uniref:Glucose dehydrogenase n=1 Tax=Brachybacterium vulturis TaxID=2017484 RepID=A0A291GS67_9MICO|nr:PQQ-dependent sugar dehydrogenase [Brachybacterium vulturis]ATG52960.1 glucose dehydrogenase [Brachybacterium vulturis]